ncbi:MAG: ABC transporter permease [Chloroflexi bacterium]|nr:ABC transporter permease [Chloroflexota bacterium]
MTERHLDMKSELDKNINNKVVEHRFKNQWRFIKVLVRRKIILFSLIILLIIIILAIFAPLIAPHDPLQQDLSNSLKNPSSQFLLGTDKFGRDLLSRLVFGSRISLLISFVAVSVGGTIGTILGIISGYFGGWVDIIIMRIIDAMLAIPMLILALAFAVVLGQGTFNIILALGIAIIPGFARLVRSVTLSVKQNDYILANRLIGASSMRTMFFHVLPNVMPPLIVHLTISLGHAILAEASLSFLGLGMISISHQSSFIINSTRCYGYSTNSLIEPGW